jgi:nitrogen regulatory protein P-II 1
VTKLEIVVRPSQLDAVREALAHPWVSGMTVSETKQFDGDVRLRVHRGRASLDAEPGLRVEVVVPRPLVPRLLAELEQIVGGRRPGTGKVFVSPVDEAVRVRTAERGEAAL